MLERVGRQGRGALIDTYRLWQEGYITRATFLDVAAQLLEHISDRGADYGRLSYAMVAAEATQTLPAIPELTGGANTKTQITKSITTVIDGAQDQIEMRLARLGYVLPIAAVQDGYEQSLQLDQLVEGWQRGMNDDACQLCRWWSHDGRVWPKAHPFQSHNGCKCQQIPVFRKTIADTQFTAAQRGRESAISRRDYNRLVEADLRARGEL